MPLLVSFGEVVMFVVGDVRRFGGRKCPSKRKKGILRRSICRFVRGITLEDDAIRFSLIL